MSAVRAGGALALLAVILVWGLRSTPADRRAPRVVPVAPDAAAKHQPLPRLGRALAAEVPARASSDEATAEQRRAEPTALRRLLRGLAAALDPEAFDRVRWDARVETAAGSLGASTLASLHGLLAATSSSERETLAGLELLRVLRRRARAEGEPLPSRALDAFRRDLRVAPQLAVVPPAIAARAVAAFGDTVDRWALMQLTRSEHDGERTLAWSALPYASDVEVAVFLVEHADPAAAAVLPAFERESGWSLLPEQVDDVAARIALRIQAPNTSEATRTRLLDALVAWAGDASTPRLLSLALDPDVSTELSRQCLARVRAWPEDWDGWERLAQRPERALLVAETTARVLELDQDPARRVQVEETLRAAYASDDLSTRRRSIQAFARLGGGSALAFFDEVLRHEPDPALRSAVVLALSRRDDPGARELLERVRTSDDCASVRAVAHHELTRVP